MQNSSAHHGNHNITSDDDLGGGGGDGGSISDRGIKTITAMIMDKMTSSEYE